MLKIFTRKPIDKQVDQASQDGEDSLRRSLNLRALVLLGIGAIVGAGIFSGAGTAIAGGAHHLGAGPGIVISYILVAIACGFAALCYAEFAAMIPQSGSAYSYSYSTLGEVIAWIIGWDLIIEYAVGNVAVAVSWSAYLYTFLSGFGITIPSWLVTDYRTAIQGFNSLQADPSITDPSVSLAANAWEMAPRVFDIPIIFNLPAVLIVALITWVVVIGIRESVRLNSVMVIIKLGILVFLIGIGVFWVDPEYWTPFFPNGWQGVSSGAALVFFAYIGFDAISTTSEETKNPQRNIPRAMLWVLLITSVLYILVSLVITGMIPWQQLGVADPMAQAFLAKGLNWAAGIISFGAVIAMASVLLVFQLGQPRIIYAMSRDGLLPKWAHKVHPKYRTPYITTILTGVFVAFFSAFANINEVIELTNIGTLFAFLLVSLGILVLRVKEPERERPFRTPFVWFVAPAAILACLYLMLQLPPVTWWRFLIWLLIGLVIYFIYGYGHSELRKTEKNVNETGSEEV